MFNRLSGKRISSLAPVGSSSGPGRDAAVSSFSAAPGSSSPAPTGGLPATLQPPSTPQAGPTSLSPVPSDAPAGITNQTAPLRATAASGPGLFEAALARQKAAFVREAYGLWKRSGRQLKLQDAAKVVAATRADEFPALAGAGKKGASLLAADKAWHNYRSWARALGKGAGGAPLTEHFEKLVRGYRGAAYERPGDSQFWASFAKLYLHPNQLSFRNAYEYTLKAWRAAGQAGDVPTLPQVYHYYKTRVDPKAVQIARIGEEFARNNLAGYISREAPPPGDCWVLDHHISDAPIHILDDSGALKAVRPWLSAVLDWGSLYFVGWVIRPISPNRDAVERSMRASMHTCGNAPARHLYIDRGKDFMAAFMNDNALSLSAYLGMQIHPALPYNARAKVVERIFGEFCKSFAKAWAGYRGSNPQSRPENAQKHWDNPESLPTLPEFENAFSWWLENVYHKRASTGKILAGRCPAEAWETREERSQVTEHQAYMAFLRPVGRRVIQEGGAVTVGRVRYCSEGLFTLLGRVREVDVRIDPDNARIVWCFDEKGRELCQATAVTPLPGIIDQSDDASLERLRELQTKHARQLKTIKAAANAEMQVARWRRSRPGASDAIFPQSPHQIEPAPLTLPAHDEMLDQFDDGELAEIAAAYETDRAERAIDVDETIDALLRGP